MAAVHPFLQTDPIGYDDQVNLYAYAGNDPVNAIDPSGKAFWLVRLVKGGIADVLKLSKKQAIIARIPRNPGWPNIFSEQGWTFLNVKTEKIAGQRLQIGTWALRL